MKIALAILGAISAIAGVVTLWFKRNPKASVDPTYKAALEIRKQVNDQTNRQLLKLQERKLDELRMEVENLNSRINSILFVRQAQSNPPAGKKDSEPEK